MKPGRELDAIIATQVMGWHIGIGKTCTSEGAEQGWYSNSGPEVAVNGWNPSTEYADAIRINDDVDTWEESKQQAYFDALDEADPESAEIDGLPSDPMIICLAALKACGVKV